MTDKEMEKIADLMESTWSNSFFKKDHKQLFSSILILMSDCDFKDVVGVIKDYVANYDNVPTLATISKLVHYPKDDRKKVRATSNYVCPKYLEDSDGYGYLLGPSGTYDQCIWRPKWAMEGRSKVDELSKYGI